VPRYLLIETCFFSKLYLKWAGWQCCLAGSSKTVPGILIFSIVLGVKYLSYVKSIATFFLIFFGYIILVLASVLVRNEIQIYRLDDPNRILISNRVTSSKL
jgi:hypothetical protein